MGELQAIVTGEASYQLGANFALLNRLVFEPAGTHNAEAILQGMKVIEKAANHEALTHDELRCLSCLPDAMGNSYPGVHSMKIDLNKSFGESVPALMYRQSEKILIEHFTAFWNRHASPLTQAYNAQANRLTPLFSYVVQPFRDFSTEGAKTPDRLERFFKTQRGAPPLITQIRTAMDDAMKCLEEENTKPYNHGKLTYNMMAVKAARADFENLVGTINQFHALRSQRESALSCPAI